jgi:hypothetical protein
MCWRPPIVIPGRAPNGFRRRPSHVIDEAFHGANPWRGLRVAWLAENPRQGTSWSDPGPYAGCVLVDDDVVVISADIGDYDAAVYWGRGRADVVMVRSAGADDYTSVGVEDPPWWISNAGETIAADGSPVSWLVASPPWDMDQEGIDWHDWLKS